MSYAYLDNMNLSEALKLFLGKIEASGFKLGEESVAVSASYGRVTSHAVYAAISSPHYNACAMDGIALCARSTFGATETTPVTLSQGTDYIVVDTGDALPEGFDAVVMVEDVVNDGDSKVKLYSAAVPWQHVRQVGEDICAGEMIVPSNTRIEPSVIGAMLAGGIGTVDVKKRPVVGIIPTGDEIVKPCANPGRGEIIEFNSSIFSAMLQKWGVETKTYDIVKDRLENIVGVLAQAASECNIVLLNAGSSAGREDFSTKAIGSLGEVFVHGLSIRPGKPAILGLIGKCPVVGVPGYPVSGVIVLEQLVKPLVEFASGVYEDTGVIAEAVLTRKLVSSLKYREFVRMKLGSVDGKLAATPLNRGAGVITSFMRADGILEIPENTEGYEAGSKIGVRLLRSMREIEKMLVVTGSHDLLLDVVSDIMKRKYTGYSISSAHVGSMGGIMAIKRREAHGAGIHLLDEETGSYNESYIKKYFPEGGVLLIKCVKRTQGIMVAEGNPLGISSLQDLSKEGLRYVNRQKGSGTRILLDYLLKKGNIQSSGIYGYDREEFTHMGVAVQIASGSADAGMGVYSAAHAYNLGFVPVCEEDYDFIIPESFMETEGVKNLLDILRSQEFADVLLSLGGYKLDEPGRIIKLY